MNWWLLKRKLHISWQIAIACAGIFIGVVLAQYFNNEYLSSGVGLVIALILIIVPLWRKYIYLIPFLLIGGIIFGLWRGSISQSELAQFKPLYGQMVSDTGNVKDDIDIGASGQIVIRLDSLIIGGRQCRSIWYPGRSWRSRYWINFSSLE